MLTYLGKKDPEHPKIQSENFDTKELRVWPRSWDSKLEIPGPIKFDPKKFGTNK